MANLDSLETASLDSHIRVIRAIQFTSQDLRPLLPTTQQKVPGTTINVYGAFLQDYTTSENPDFCVFSSWIPAIVGGTQREGPSAGTFEGHMQAAGGKETIRARGRWAVPMCSGVPSHWVLGSVDFGQQSAVIYDSMPDSDSVSWAKPLLFTVVNRILQYINRATFLSVDDTWSFRVISPPMRRQQSDGWSCGVFVLLALHDFVHQDSSYQQGQEILLISKQRALESLMQLPYVVAPMRLSASLTMLLIAFSSIRTLTVNAAELQQPSFVGLSGRNSKQVVPSWRICPLPGETLLSEMTPTVPRRFGLLELPVMARVCLLPQRLLKLPNPWSHVLCLLESLKMQTHCSKRTRDMWLLSRRHLLIPTQYQAWKVQMRAHQLPTYHSYQEKKKPVLMVCTGNIQYLESRTVRGPATSGVPSARLRSI
ncbi:uncharacterized protein B0H18DRAFT_265021 [Fomitopsis serialis]|uniref:uncharacterized protein n=1 Tax=Fomitopsis serialis TaxID=139415 RepID=UPI0020079312|nr:uncharacterized protein B0H18DRAFT_265021 [Neoantrodia serialis]KAH9928183.1 hypothetical protein B0H18DRAFT_265021 [Neoantrodia serialis]